MSYSFQVKGSSKADAKAQVADQMDKVVAQQPVHAADRDAAVSVAGAFVDLLDHVEGADFHVSVNGWVGSSTDGVTSASVSVTASAKKT